MDQKNTIVKCTANPTCLFNHNGICDNYVITIGADGSCQEYVETEEKDWPPSTEQILQRTIDYELEQKNQRCLRCEDCKYFENTGLLQCPCRKHSCYKHRLELPCEDFIRR